MFRYQIRRGLHIHRAILRTRTDSFDACQLRANFALRHQTAELGFHLRWRDEDRGLDADIVRDGCLRTRAELREILMGLSAERWNRWGQRVAADISGEHYEHHLADAGVRTS